MHAASAADVQRTFAAIDLSALRRNVQTLAKRYGNICAVVKADAYGHGLVPCARAAVAGGASAIAVATPAEGQLLRACGLHTPIHILSPAEPFSARICVHQRLTPHVSGVSFLSAFLDAGGGVGDCFLMLDTGMGREGLLGTDTLTALRKLNITETFGGLSTHLAAADSEDDASLKGQYATFIRCVTDLSEAGLVCEHTVLSINNSAGMLWDTSLAPLSNPILHRPGALIYGIAPQPEKPCPTTPILSWRARIHLVKELPAGHSIGYGATYVTKRPSRIATIGVGYADGYPRNISHDAHVLIRGEQAQICGVVSMDQLQVDVTDIPGVSEGDWVTLIGTEGTLTITVSMLARWAGVPVQWPTSGLSTRVPRRYSGLE
ncbi:MAG: alanine racemase [Armatimonadota bacterium]